MEKTYYPKASEITQEWHLADANGQNLGRFASKLANENGIGCHLTFS